MDDMLQKENIFIEYLETLKDFNALPVNKKILDSEDFEKVDLQNVA
ncbi:MAG: hypothetical protein N4A33_03680 [Bacteriovoracaceae bacterium]|nr:hypothetical protein [Bacteriovoracaceae bacterium]